MRYSRYWKQQRVHVASNIPRAEKWHLQHRPYRAEYQKMPCSQPCVDLPTSISIQRTTTLPAQISCRMMAVPNLPDQRKQYLHQYLAIAVAIGVQPPGVPLPRSHRRRHLKLVWFERRDQTPHRQTDGYPNGQTATDVSPFPVENFQ